VYCCKKLDYQEARVKELLKRPACMPTSLVLSRNLNSKITINSWCIAAGSRQSLMRIHEYWTTHGLATRRGFTYPVMWIPKTHVCGVVKTCMHCSRNPSISRKSGCVLCLITATLQRESKQAPRISPHDWQREHVCVIYQLSLGSCNHCNLAYFHWYNNFEHPSSNHGLCSLNSK
jgi:hypothetical protein